MRAGVLLRGIEEFREHLGGELTITLLRDIGRGEEVHRIDTDEILHAVTWLRRREIGQ
jgi:3-dehydroquinate synthase